jgi:TetR/AcrR family transcriptional regulator, transcriptional repressor for nem operon
LDSAHLDRLQAFLEEAMGHSGAEKAKTHERIVALASKRFREKGLEGIGIAELMKPTGLTVGGFYKHFGSRDDLVGQALGSAVGPWKGLVDAAASGGPPVTYDSLVDACLSETHRNHPGTGGPVGALAGDVARSNKRTRAVLTKQVSEYIAWLADLIGDASGEDKAAARSRAVMSVCALVGAITISRAVSDELLSCEILKTVAQLVKNPGAADCHRSGLTIV